MSDKLLIEALQADNARLNQKLKSIESAYFDIVQQYESTPQRALAELINRFNLSRYSLPAKLKILHDILLENDLTADDIKEDIEE